MRGVDRFRRTYPTSRGTLVPRSGEDGSARSIRPQSPLARPSRPRVERDIARYRMTFNPSDWAARALASEERAMDEQQQEVAATATSFSREAETGTAAETSDDDARQELVRQEHENIRNRFDLHSIPQPPTEVVSAVAQRNVQRSEILRLGTLPSSSASIAPSTEPATASAPSADRLYSVAPQAITPITSALRTTDASFHTLQESEDGDHRQPQPPSFLLSRRANALVDTEGRLPPPPASLLQRSSSIRRSGFRNDPASLYGRLSASTSSENVHRSGGLPSINTVSNSNDLSTLPAPLSTSSLFPVLRENTSRDAPWTTGVSDDVVIREYLDRRMQHYEADADNRTEEGVSETGAQDGLDRDAPPTGPFTDFSVWTSTRRRLERDLRALQDAEERNTERETRRDHTHAAPESMLHDLDSHDDSDFFEAAFDGFLAGSSSASALSPDFIPFRSRRHRLRGSTGADMNMTDDGDEDDGSTVSDPNRLSRSRRILSMDHDSMLMSAAEFLRTSL